MKTYLVVSHLIKNVINLIKDSEEFINAVKNNDIDLVK
jgi:hypothetical protein